MTTDNLIEQREAAANAAFEAYDFHDAQVEAVNGWEFCSPGTEMTRAIFLAPIEGGEGTDLAHFTVRFRGYDSAEIAEVYAIAQSGNIFGRMPEEAAVA
ncbi:hypothetical protein F6X40_36315 [Paraburkholderia sp. UCT31]|uniref:hypothetical protein n=1 Tax=Paraburkholderia sp. UCT31 TaxID=2615209 RepID=UPI0016562BE8|nr:hypothetical protein [Paraburkholderia sp. UCT31]MBC8742006.1 hypothetical protein [Paraburkholderia sp. UCT31]